MTVEGLDLSHWDSVNEYSLAGKGFVVIKLTEGSGYVDPSFGAHLAKAEAAGVLIGAYHFARDDSAIDAQARDFVMHVPSAVTFLAVDNEGVHAMTRTQLVALIAAIRKYDTRNLPILLYMSEGAFIYSAGQDYNWIANWASPPSRAHLLWQYQSGSHNTSGEDQDRYNGTLDELRAILGGTQEANMAGIAYEFDSTAKVGKFTVVGPDHRYLNLSTGGLGPLPAGAVHDAFGPVTLVGRGITGTADTRKVGYVIGKQAAFAITADGTFAPTAAEDGFTQFTQTAAVAAQRTADQATVDAATAAASKAAADLANAPGIERERIARVVGDQEANRIRNI